MTDLSHLNTENRALADRIERSRIERLGMTRRLTDRLVWGLKEQMDKDLEHIGAIADRVVRAVQ